MCDKKQPSSHIREGVCINDNYGLLPMRRVCTATDYKSNDWRRKKKYNTILGTSPGSCPSMWVEKECLSG